MSEASDMLAFCSGLIGQGFEVLGNINFFEYKLWQIILAIAFGFAFAYWAVKQIIGPGRHYPADMVDFPDDIPDTLSDGVGPGDAVRAPFEFEANYDPEHLGLYEVMGATAINIENGAERNIKGSSRLHDFFEDPIMYDEEAIEANEIISGDEFDEMLEVRKKEKELAKKQREELEEEEEYYSPGYYSHPSDDELVSYFDDDFGDEL
ncbi:TPA: hypothetical protein HA338_08895 [Methanosarcina acetivorans]|uniref:Uncharacterized protein n=2 Tax=Methanosarcina acetivorans TaxID=2214 RepID=Q8TM58_METAC|nr:hypothetical protein [Methanosarcina acetivorans]AAM06189.1 predicted protein [Methanosarcina acetivorans C2A]HIH94145.1 hypothetical protein [Methanosarcina acetivorans]